MPSQREKESAALEIIKLHQLVITKNRAESLKKSVGPSEEIDTETMENAAPCLLTMTNDTIKEESWLGSKRSTYRVQKAKLTVKDKVQKVESFSNYLIPPMRKRYDLVFQSTAVSFKRLLTSGRE